MTEKQRKCINWICNVLDIEYQLSDSGFDAWRLLIEISHLLRQK